MTERIPVTVLTGYLGAGKTTLLNRILSEDHGRRYAVIVNEFGEIGIDNDLILNTDEELFEMNNGCICCTVRGDLIKTHARPAGQARAISTRSWWRRPAWPTPDRWRRPSSSIRFLQERTALDSVTTVVDAKHILLRLADSREAAEQIAFADQIVLNKTELVTDEELREIEARLRKLNPLAPIHRAQRSNVPLDKVLGRGGFDIDRIVALEPDFLEPAHGEAGHVHDEHCEHDHNDHARARPRARRRHQQHLAHLADSDGSAARSATGLTYVVQSQGPDILRAKGIIDVKGESRAAGVPGRAHDAGRRPAAPLEAGRAALQPAGLHRPQSGPERIADRV